MADVARRVAVVSRHPATLRQIQQALGVAGLGMRQAIGPSFLPKSAKGEFEAVVLDLDIDPTTQPSVLVEAVAAACPETPVIAVAGVNTRHRLIQALAQAPVIGLQPKVGSWNEPGPVPSLAGAPAPAGNEGPDEQELGVALRRLLARSGPEVPLGPQPYLLGGSPVEERVVGSTSEKETVLAEVLAYAQRFALSDEKLRRVEVVTDELLLNAIYDAPRDMTPSGSGNWQPVPRYAMLDRRTPITLAAKEQVRLRYASDGRTFAVSVNDRFGALPRATIAAHLARVLEVRGPRPKAGAGGAGLGLVLCYTTANQLIVHSLSNKFTEVTAVLHIAGSNRRAVERGSALHLYTI